MCENCKCGNGSERTASYPINASPADHLFVNDKIQYNSDGVSRELVLKQLEDTGLEAVSDMLLVIGEDPEREGLLETPKRVVKSWKEIFSGYGKDPKDIMKHFDSDGADQIVLVANIELYSMCEHHLLPFFGVAHVAYIPNGRVLGLSKLARLVDIFARRAQIQERIGEQVTAALMEHLQPLGAACVIEAQHMCMQMRGVSKQNSHTVTSSMKGAFMDKPAAREELLQLIQMRKK